jgi:hypothetical protein
MDEVFQPSIQPIRPVSPDGFLMSLECRLPDRVKDFAEGVVDGP